jgi:hypothetical protein
MHVRKISSGYIFTLTKEQTMKTAARISLLTTLLAGVIAGAGSAAAGEAKPVPADFAVYIDQPTLFAYIKTPAGWKFIRKVDEKSYQAYRTSLEDNKLGEAGK